MRILHVLHSSLPVVCGYSIRSGYIVDLQREMGFQTFAVTSAQQPQTGAARETIQGTEYRRTRSAAPSRLPLAREWQLMRCLEHELETAVQELRPDVIHAHSPVLVGLPALRVARRFGIPLVYEIRDLWENASVDRGRFSTSSPLYKLARGLETYVLRNATAVVTICDLLKNELAPRLDRQDKIHVIPNGVDAQSFQPHEASETLRERWRLGGKDVILYAGTFQPYEGLDLIVRALSELVRHRPETHAVFVGGSAGLVGNATAASPEEAQLLAVVNELNLGDHVTFTGRIPHGDVKAMIALADVVVYPRRWTRTTALTTPLKPLEAMSMGKPVIASNVPALCELVSDDNTGLLFEAGDHHDLARQCEQLLSDAPRRVRLGANAREWVLRERQWRALVSNYRDVYDAVVAGHHVPQRLSA